MKEGPLEYKTLEEKEMVKEKSAENASEDETLKTLEAKELAETTEQGSG